MTGRRLLLAVTGGTGFIGRRFVEAVRGVHDVRLLLRDPAGLSGADARRFDLLGEEPLDPVLLEDVDAVIHLAARVPPDHFDPSEAKTCMAANAFGTLRLVEAMRAAGVGRLLQTTSANAYAPWVERPDEEAALYPVSRVYYLASKIAQELLAGASCAAGGIGLTTLRLSSVYGAGQSKGAVPALIRALRSGERLRLIDGGRFGADFVQVNDVVAALLRCLEGGVSGVYNVGSGQRATIRDIACHLLAIAGEDEQRLDIRPGGDTADFGFAPLAIEKLEALGWGPTPLEHGLAVMLAALDHGGGKFAANAGPAPAVVQQCTDGRW
ncbi:NAD(P)-dependent oxidoreductase [Sphingosinicella sp. BN140058]|uniref:NAD-dependent epimerase/dehydratase family protein n=1 Tax=Sphingosinicella sp. BN140058 TaxID=1892855 RepID=UPI001012C564|nr:NAD(P)-dependent oxidoreductase [Sphingosinicella sp. BN140058]QAY78052.1 NAD(P)-dependent oxidoreductase [Sphingosinicella sp. BN140058]